MVVDVPSHGLTHDMRWLGKGQPRTGVWANGMTRCGFFVKGKQALTGVVTCLECTQSMLAEAEKTCPSL